MEQFIELAEQFGIPVMMLGCVSYALVKLFQWMANDLMQQIKAGDQRIENIVIKLIDNSKKEREQNREQFNAILQRMDAIVDVMVKLTGNGLKK